MIVRAPTQLYDYFWAHSHSNLRERLQPALYSSPSTVRVTESRIMRWWGNAARTGRVEVYTEFW
jgi:hypothetical protein